MDRQLRDESFVRVALSLANIDTARHIAKQELFNQDPDKKIDAVLHSLLVASASILAHELDWESERINEIIEADTYGKAQDFVDRYYYEIPYP